MLLHVVKLAADVLKRFQLLASDGQLLESALGFSFALGQLLLEIGRFQLQLSQLLLQLGGQVVLTVAKLLVFSLELAYPSLRSTDLSLGFGKLGLDVLNLGLGLQQGRLRLINLRLRFGPMLLGGGQFNLHRSAFILSSAQLRLKGGDLSLELLALLTLSAPQILQFSAQLF